MKRLIILAVALLATLSCTAQKELPVISIQGKDFVTPDGKPFVFRGLCLGDCSKVYNQEMWNQKLFGEAADWGANCVRFCIHPKFINEVGWDEYFAIVDAGVELAKANGLYVILDWHSIGNLVLENFYEQYDYYPTTQEETIKFWRMAAERYKDEPTVAVYELFNEPTTGDYGELGNSTWHDWKLLMETLIDNIREIDPAKPCLVAGLDWAYECKPIGADPVERENVAYCAHPYPLKAAQPWPENWEADYGYLADKYPVICTEVGYCLPGEPCAHGPVPTADPYGPQITEYFESKGISFTVWCFDINYSPILITDWDFTLATPGKFFKQYFSKYKK